jgi:hypothetical protein
VILFCGIDSLSRQRKTDQQGELACKRKPGWQALASLKGAVPAQAADAHDVCTRRNLARTKKMLWWWWLAVKRYAFWTQAELRRLSQDQSPAAR